MSDSLTIEHDDAPPVRNPRRDRADRNPTYDREQRPDATFEVADTPSPEAIVADSTRQLQEKDREVAEARRAAREASQQAAAARAEAAQARASQQTDQHAVIAQALEGAKAEQTAARATIKAAREAGDVDAEMTAVEALSAATYRVTQASAELARIQAQPRQPAAPQTQAPPRPQISARAQQWLDEHPRYNADRQYKAMAQMAHNEAIERGYSTDSQDYIDHIENVLTTEYGSGHGRVPERTPPVNNATRQPSARDGVPSARSNGNATPGGFQQIRTQLHKEPILVQRGANGAMKIRFFSAEQQKDFQEGADTCRMSLADYVLDHINVANEIATGGSGDLVRGDGAKFE